MRGQVKGGNKGPCQTPPLYISTLAQHPLALRHAPLPHVKATIAMCVAEVFAKWAACISTTLATVARALADCFLTHLTLLEPGRWGQPESPRARAPCLEKYFRTPATSLGIPQQSRRYSSSPWAWRWESLRSCSACSMPWPDPWQGSSDFAARPFGLCSQALPH